MTSHFARAALAAAAIAVAALAIGSRARPASAASGAVEHKVVLVSFEDYKDTDEYKQAEKELKSPLAAVLHVQEVVLGELGKQGWELVAIEAKAPSQAIFYLKRHAG
jgi:hypothetical protein